MTAKNYENKNYIIEDEIHQKRVMYFKDIATSESMRKK